MTTKGGEPVPAELAEALTADPVMLALWDGLRPSCQREHARYVGEAKGTETRTRRVARVLEMTRDWHARRPARPAKG